ncbi:hypothetical protein SETIT_6G131100v2, partial [Setaria italica]
RRTLEKASRGRPLDIVAPGPPAPAPRATAPPHAHILTDPLRFVTKAGGGRGRASDVVARRLRVQEEAHGEHVTAGHICGCWPKPSSQPWSSGCQAAPARAPSGCVPRGDDTGGRTAAETPAM